jgi:hypothetical protein
VEVEEITSASGAYRKRGIELPVGLSREPSSGAGGGDESHGDELLGVAIVCVIHSHLQYSNTQHK